MGSDVTRYNFHPTWEVDLQPQDSEDGFVEFVKAEDYRALEAERDALRELLQAWVDENCDPMDYDTCTNTTCQRTRQALTKGVNDEN